ncbi:MAG: phage portal protein [Rikenellaceae bacterium]
MTLDEILKSSDIESKISYLKNRETTLPDAISLMKDWDPMKHEVMDKEKRPDGVKIKIEAFDEEVNGKIVPHAATYEADPKNRIALPIEQDQVNIHTAFTVGTEPKIVCMPNNEKEQELLRILKSIHTKNKLKYQNKKIVRAWLSECEACEYWFTVDDNDGFWNKVINKLKKSLGIRAKPKKRLKSTVWSPFNGDKLYPLFDDKGDLIAMSREYETTNIDNTTTSHFMTVTKDMVYQWDLDKDWEEVAPFRHNFSKMPIVYIYREHPLCRNIKPLRERLEKLTSDYADCIDYNFFPRLVSDGEVVGRPSKDNGDMIKVENGAKVWYLTWSQTPEQAKFEFENLFDQSYSYTNTPRITFKNLQGTGGAVAGVAFDYVFLSTHLKVDEHNEDIGPFLQRRTNFLVTAIGDLNKDYTEASETIDAICEPVPFRIDDLAQKIDAAAQGVSNGVMSTKQGVMLVGIADEVDEELKLIKEDSAIDALDIAK